MDVFTETGVVFGFLNHSANLLISDRVLHREQFNTMDYLLQEEYTEMLCCGPETSPNRLRTFGRFCKKLVNRIHLPKSPPAALEAGGLLNGPNFSQPGAHCIRHLVCRLAVNRQYKLPKNTKKLPKDATEKSFRRNAVLCDRSSHPTD